MGKVKDFSSYITEIKSSGAQALITGNWGPDMSLLIKQEWKLAFRQVLHALRAPRRRTIAIGPAGNGKVVVIQAFNETSPQRQGILNLKTGRENSERRMISISMLPGFARFRIHSGWLQQGRFN